LPVRPVLFLDDGGVLNDNSVRGEQWRWMVADYFVPILGGSREAWAEANWTIINEMLYPEAWEARMKAAPDYATFDYDYQRDWMYAMCRLVGVTPPSEVESVALARQASAHIIPRVYSPYPGVVETVRLLHEQGYTLNTSSGATSTDMAAYLTGMGIRDCFNHLYGPDLIETFKMGPEFYERLLADAGVEPSDALVLDDNPKCARWAKQAGAQVLLVSNAPQTAAESITVIGSLAEVPGFIDQYYS